MKLISKFDDYYDIGVSYGVDPNVVYNREETRLDETQVLNYIGLVPSDKPNYNDIVKGMTSVNEVIEGDRIFLRINPCCVVLGFCGWWYFGVALSGNEIYWNKSDRAYEEIEKHWQSKYYLHEKSQAVTFLEKKPVYNIDPFIHFETPIISLENISVTWEVWKDVNLSEIGFAHVVDPWTAFQEVNMFVTGIMGQSIPSTVEVSDKDLRDAKGFDNMSFKKPKQKRK